MAKTISQRISLEGSEDLRKKLEELGRAGEKAFKQIADAAKQPIADPQKIEETKRAADELAKTAEQLQRQFGDLADGARQFGNAGVEATKKVSDGLKQNGIAANTLVGIFQGVGQKIFDVFKELISIIPGLTEGTVKTAEEIKTQADKLGLTIPQLLELRTQWRAAGVDIGEMEKQLIKIIEAMKRSVGGLAQIAPGSQLAIKTVKTLTGEIVTVVTGLGQVRTEADLFATALRQIGITGKDALDKLSPAMLRRLADFIANITNETQRAKLGTQLFGEQWEKVVESMRSTKPVVDEAGKTLAELGKAHRQLSAADVEAALALKEALKDRDAALKALKDKIGALFVGGPTARAKWMTEFIDGTTELLTRYGQLSEEQRKFFADQIGEGPAQSAFKFLLAASEQLSALWNDVLVPAGKSLMNMFREIGASLGGISGERVAAGFTVAATAIGALGLALKGLGILLAPIGVFFSGFGLLLVPLIGLIASFWEEIKVGGTAAFAGIEPAMQNFKAAFSALLRGDFKGFWQAFSFAAVEAFNIIIKNLQSMEGVIGDFVRGLSGMEIKTPWVAALFEAFNQIKENLPEIILGFTSMLLLFAKFPRATGMAAALTLVSSALQSLAYVAIIVVSAVKLLEVAIPLLIRIFGGPAVAIASLVAALILFRKEVAEASIALNNFLNDFVRQPIQDAFAWIGQTFSAAIDAAAEKLAEFKSQLGLFFQPITNAFEWFKNLFPTREQIKEFLDTVPGPDELLKRLFQPVSGAWDWIKTAWDGVIAWIGQKITEGVQLITEFVTTPVASAWDWIKTSFQSVIDWVAGKWAEFKASIGLGGGAAPTGTTGGSFAGGGLLGGRGTGTSDSNLAWVSRGEYITPARAVRQPGVLAFLEALRRSGGNLRDVLDGMGRFALGGLVVPSAIPAMAGGGSMHPVTINFAGTTVAGLRASSDVVEELRRAAVLAQVRSGGRKPSRYS